MKQRYTYWTFIAFTLLINAACSQNEENIPGKEGKVEVENICASVGEIEVDLISTRALADYNSNNVNYDPTRSLTVKGDNGWLLDLEIYYDYGDGNGQVRYEPGCGVLTYDRYYSASNYIYGYWRLKDDTNTDKPLFLPNYKKQEFQAMLYPAGWKPQGGFINYPNWGNDIPEIKQDQRDLNIFREQDILIAYMGKSIMGTPVITPEKSVAIGFKHYYTMLNFKLGNIDYSKIHNIKVLVDNNNDNNYTEYTPYQVKHLTNGTVVEGEYMAIIYPNKGNIQIKLTTDDGIEYRQQLTFPSNHNSGRGQQNYCYCFTLTGIELVLSPITVKNWATGETVDAGYTTETAYPTFMGPKDTTYILWYDNGLSQEITFSSQGECIVLPIGRTIKFIEYNGIKTELNNPITLGNMLIDLNNFS